MTSSFKSFVKDLGKKIKVLAEDTFFGKEEYRNITIDEMVTELNDALSKTAYFYTAEVRSRQSEQALWDVAPVKKSGVFVVNISPIHPEFNSRLLSHIGDPTKDIIFISSLRKIS